MESVVFKLKDGVGYITLNRPEAMNSMNFALLGELSEVVRCCRRDPAVRVLVLRGNGRAFCAGGDVKWMQENLNDPHWAAEFHRLVGSLNQGIMLIRNIEKPVIAAVHGFASGAGFSLALACDLRLAAEGTRFSRHTRSGGTVPDAGYRFALSARCGQLFSRGD